MGNSEALNIIDRFRWCHRVAMECIDMKCEDCPFNYTKEEVISACLTIAHHLGYNQYGVKEEVKE